MPKIRYTARHFSAGSLKIIQQANQIITNMQNQGYDLTLRQLYYQFVSANLIPNKDTEYKRLGSIINDARLAGLIDWDAIIDRTRFVRSISHWDTPADVIKAASSSFRLNKWEDQPKRIEVWIEKDALVGVIQRVCNLNDLPYFACRGYVSQSEVWGAAQRIGSYIANGQDVIILHLGDHDPSGVDMSRDIEDRLKLFLHEDWLQDASWIVEEFHDTMWDDEEYGDRDDYEYSDATGWKTKAKEDLKVYTDNFYSHLDWAEKLEVRRIALNTNQVRQYNPPPNPAKLTDARAKKYIAIHGQQSWELDALTPSVINQLVQDEVDAELDQVAWDATMAKEAENRRQLKAASDQWSVISNGL